MRNILIAASLFVVSTVFANPIPCISLNGRAYVPMSRVSMTQAPPEYSRNMCETDFVWVRTVAESHGGHLQWSGRVVELRDWNGHTLYSFLPMPPRDFWRSDRVEDNYPDLIAAAGDRAAPHVKPATQWQFKMAWAGSSRRSSGAYEGGYAGGALAAERMRLQRREQVGLGGIGAYRESLRRENQTIGAYADEQGPPRHGGLVGVPNPVDWNPQMRKAAWYFPLVLLPLVALSGCDDGVSGIWEGTITTTEGVVDRYGSRTETETLPFSVKLERDDGGTLDGVVKWGTIDPNNEVSLIGGHPIAYGTIMDDGHVTFSANTSTAAARAMGFYSGTIDGETLTGALRCTGEGVGKKAILVGKFTLKRK